MVPNSWALQNVRDWVSITSAGESTRPPSSSDHVFTRPSRPWLFAIKRQALNGRSVVWLAPPTSLDVREQHARGARNGFTTQHARRMAIPVTYWPSCAHVPGGAASSVVPGQPRHTARETDHKNRGTRMHERTLTTQRACLHTAHCPCVPLLHMTPAKCGRATPPRASELGGVP